MTILNSRKITKTPEYLLGFLISGSGIHKVCYLFALAVSIVIMPELQYSI